MKRYYAIDTPDGPSSVFRRHAYHLINTPLTTLVHYIGDERKATDFPHGNSKSKKYLHTHSHHIQKHYIRHLKQPPPMYFTTTPNVLYKRAHHICL